MTNVNQYTVTLGRCYLAAVYFDIASSQPRVSCDQHHDNWSRPLLTAPVETCMYVQMYVQVPFSGSNGAVSLSVCLCALPEFQS